MKTCGDCRFYQFHSQNEKLENIGICHRFPPVAINENQSGHSIVGSTSRECGEFKRKSWLTGKR